MGIRLAGKLFSGEINMRNFCLFATVVFVFFMTAAPVIKILSKPLIPQPGAPRLDYTPGIQSGHKQEAIKNNDTSPPKYTYESANLSCGRCSNITTAGPTVFPVIAPITNINQNNPQQQYNHKDCTYNNHHGCYYTYHYYLTNKQGEWRLAADGKYWWHPTPPNYYFDSCKNNTSNK